MSERAARRRVLVLSQDRLDGQIAGTSIRALELGKVLAAAGHDVTLAGVGEPPARRHDLPCVGYDPQHPAGLAGALDAADVVVSLQQWPPLMRLLRNVRARIAFDLYVPQALETIGGFPGVRPRVRHELTEFAVDRTVDALRAGDFFLCATEGQRDLYLGMMLAERLIDGPRYHDDPSLRSLIDVVPFGLPDGDAAATGAGGPRRHVPGVGPGDDVVLWNGGVWPWLDPQAAVRAVAQVAQRRPRVRLVFMGAAPQVPAQRAAAAARATAQQLGVLDRHVFFHDSWVPYDERADWLLEADCALYAHHDHLETRFSFRTRLLDCFWARLPVACTGGDDLSAQIQREGAGVVVAPEDVGALAAAVEEILDRGRGAYAEPLARLADRHRWSAVAAPLARFVDGAAAPPAPARSARPGHLARHYGYLALRRGLDLAGRRDWPRL
jgi:glycosyltransferase involved in cell wall biosynthesis